MTVRLYDSAWVCLHGQETPLQAMKDRKNPALFMIGDYVYDIDGRPVGQAEGAPPVSVILSLQAVKEMGLKSSYNSDNNYAF